MASDTSALAVQSRERAHSRAARRLRRAGFVPGVLYGGGEDPIAFQVEARVLRQTLAHSGAVIEVSVDGAKATPAVLKDQQRHPVRGETTHVDLIRVRLDQPIQAVVSLEFTGVDDSPGIKKGGVFEQLAREVTIEALPTSIPESIEIDASGLDIGDTVTLAAAQLPQGVTLMDELDVDAAVLSAPRLQAEEEEEIERETGVVGEEAAAGEGEGEGGE